MTFTRLSAYNLTVLDGGSGANRVVVVLLDGGGGVWWCHAICGGRYYNKKEMGKRIK